MAAPLIALVNRAPAHLDESEVERVARALQTQVHRDAGPVWGIGGHVSSAGGRRAPRGSWPIYVVMEPQSGLGVHLDHHGHPFAEVLAGELWTVAVSHQLLEMLVDPLGARFMDAPCPARLSARPVRYLVEVCDPCGAHRYAIDGIAVSDFVTPDYYRPAAPGPAFDFLRRLGRALEVAPGGRLCWHDPSDGRWHERRPDGSVTAAAEARHDDDGAHAGSPREERDRAFGDADDRHGI